VWSLLGAKLRLHNAAGLSCALSAALLALVILLSLPAAQTSAVARDTADRSQTSDANQPDYNAGQSAYATGRFVEALRIWRPLAESGDPRAAFGLGLLYDLGEGVGQDAAAAYVWYRTAAEAGVVAAEFNIAVMCDSGVGTARNAAEAAVWYGKAAVLGDLFMVSVLLDYAAKLALRPELLAPPDRSRPWLRPETAQSGCRVTRDLSAHFARGVATAVDYWPPNPLRRRLRSRSSRSAHLRDRDGKLGRGVLCPSA
jgi:Sel1 repeat